MDSETETYNEGLMYICSRISESQQDPLTKMQSTQIHVYIFEKGDQCEEANGSFFF
uniref:Uncharacterized protein n=1 Tax=Lepeophtheirus salmonis TaxID=72036 RepID=A0A0K2V3I0_LEPSM